jgi:diphosphomevalonate decarboxylase
MNSKLVTKVNWSAPSNIALIKYWGKFGVQLPKNPSISFTLKHSLTKMEIEVYDDRPGEIEFFFEGVSHEKFKEKIAKFIKSIEERFLWTKKYRLKINTSNTFPHSSGIASSASSMSALCLCLLSLNESLQGEKVAEESFYQSASELARLGSGSASRSLYAPMASWGECSMIEGSSNQHASLFNELHPIYSDYCDTILIVDANEKSVSSRAGHSLMENHPFRDVRFKVARENMDRLIVSLKTGDLPTFIEIVEEEALTLHALMMTSRPSYILLRPESLFLINEIKLFREKEKIPACFTIDAGPNIHLLYPKAYARPVRHWIETSLADAVVGLKWIHDEVGTGPLKI